MRITKSLVVKIVLAILAAATLFFAGSYFNYYYETKQAEKEALQKKQQNIELRKKFSINIGGLKPHMPNKEAIDVAKSHGYDYSLDEPVKSGVSKGNRRMYVHGLSALGIDWDEFNCILTEDEGVCDISLTTKASELTEEQVIECLRELVVLFPGGKVMPEPNFSIIVGDKTIPVPRDNEKLFEYHGMFHVNLRYKEEKDELFCYIAPGTPY